MTSGKAVGTREASRLVPLYPKPVVFRRRRYWNRWPAQLHAQRHYDLPKGRSPKYLRHAL